MKVIKYKNGMGKVLLLFFLQVLALLYPATINGQTFTKVDAIQQLSNSVKISKKSLPSINSHSPRVWYDFSYSNNILTSRYSISNEKIDSIEHYFSDLLKTPNMPLLNALKEEELVRLLFMYEDARFFSLFAIDNPIAIKLFNTAKPKFHSIIYNQSKSKILYEYEYSYKDIDIVKEKLNAGLSGVEILSLYMSELGMIKGFELIPKIGLSFYDKNVLKCSTIKDRIIYYYRPLSDSEFKETKLTNVNELKESFVKKTASISTLDNQIEILETFGYTIKIEYKNEDIECKNYTIEITNKELCNYLKKMKE